MRYGPLLAVSWFLCWHPAPRAAEQAAGPLAAYVERVDESYGWVKRRQADLGEHELVELTLTSQTWRDVVWKHQLFIIKPRKLRDASRALLFISGGSWRDELADPPADAKADLPRDTALWTTLATQIAAPVAVLLHVPQQPMFNGMKEDQIISYTFEQFLKTGDATWPLLLPMVKSAVRGMDACRNSPSRNGRCRSNGSRSPGLRNVAGPPGSPPRSTNASRRSPRWSSTS